MPFDIPAASAKAGQNRRLLGIWLFALCAMVGVMIVLGGATRLTGSGLSIMEWAPLLGALPPLSDAEWRRLFDLYQRIPQYHLQHEGFGLDGFRQIFWLEWAHRLWGRLIGVAFAVPLIWLWGRGAIPRRLRPRLLLLFALGGLQGGVGWFMVASGFLPDTTAVSPYRLVVHLALALLLFGALLWTGLSSVAPHASAADAALRRCAWMTTVLVGLTILAGGFVAGTHAGLLYNTFPLMDGRLVPAGYASLSPFLRNLTENLAAVQFDHRLLATLSAVAAAATLLVGLRRRPAFRLRVALLGLGAAVAAQYGLGVATLLAVVPTPLAVAHQAVAVLVLSAALATLHAAVRPASVRVAGVVRRRPPDNMPRFIPRRRSPAP